MRKVFALLVPTLILLSSCGGGGGNGVMQSPPANVAGVWTTVANNAGSAILTGCTGDLTSLNGLTIAGIASTATCVYSGPIVTTQSGNSYTILARTYTCDNGDFGSDAGGGTVSGKSLQGQLDTISTFNGTAGTDYLKGTAASAITVNLSEYYVSISGTVNGSCKISPNLSITATISQPLQGMTLDHEHAPDARSLARMLTAYRRRNP
jgi:hypothetical protein